MQIKKLIISIQQRPKMFVKEEKIEYIYYLLSGYCGASKRVHDDEMDQKFCLWFGQWLKRWITNNFDAEYVSTTAYWYDDIKVMASESQDEFRLFFELCTSFFEDYENKIGYFSWRNW